MRAFLSLVGIVISSALLGQSNMTFPEEGRKVLLTKVAFLTNDTIRPYTLVQQPNGSLYFESGHRFTEDTITLEKGVAIQVSEIHKGALIPNVVFEKTKEPLELNDLFDHFSLKHGGVLNTYDIKFQFIPYIHELKYSYVFHKIGLPQLSGLDSDSIIRLTNCQLSPFGAEDPQITIYELTLTSTLNQIRKSTYLIDSHQDFFLSNEEIIPLTKSELELISETIQSCLIEKVRFSTKTKQYNPFLIELKLGDSLSIIERSDYLDGDEKNGNMHNYHSEYQSLIGLVNSVGNLSPSKIARRRRKMNK